MTLGGVGTEARWPFRDTVAYPEAVNCPNGTTLTFYAELGHATHNTDWNNNQYCRTWVEPNATGDGIICTGSKASMEGCANAGIGFCQ
jgi:hypothetical protein